MFTPPVFSHKDQYVHARDNRKCLNAKKVSQAPLKQSCYFQNDKKLSNMPKAVSSKCRKMHLNATFNRGKLPCLFISNHIRSTEQRGDEGEDDLPAGN